MSERPPLAVVGLSALFPGSLDKTGFWRDILAGRDLITEVPESHWLISDYYDPATWDGIELHSLAYSEGNKIEYYRDSRQNVASEIWSPKPGSSLSPASRRPPCSPTVSR